MKKRLAVVAAVLCAALCMSACGSVFDKEYVKIEPYVPTVQESSVSDGRVTVRNFSGLKQAILSLVSNGEAEGSIAFDPAYDGDAAEDMASACWQVRTQDALCAYCVDNISYELSKIVTYYEAKLHVTYASFVENAANIVKLPYSAGVEQIIKTALDAGQTKLVVLINRSSYSAEDMDALVARVYREYPATAPRAPGISVNMYSGANMQRLYEINLRYGMPAEELAAKKRQLDAFRPFAGVNSAELDEAERALMAYEYLSSHCVIADEGQGGSIYAALIECRSDSEGAALGYVELCRQLGLDCRIVYGQQSWKEHCWNIVRIGGDYYHVDAGLAAVDLDRDFLRPDRSFWENYRWDVSSYPVCTGELTYDDVIAARAAPDSSAATAADSAEADGQSAESETTDTPTDAPDKTGETDEKST